MRPPDVVTNLTMSDGRPAPTLSEVVVDSYARLVGDLDAVLGDHQEAERLAQEAFVRAAAAGDRFLLLEDREGWLRRKALRLHHSRWRRLRRRPRRRPRPVSERPAAHPDHGVIVRRGARLRRRRSVAVGAAALVMVTAAGWLADPDLDVPPAPARLSRDPVSVELARWPAKASAPPVAAGTFTLAFSLDVDAPSAQIATPAGWRSWFGPLRRSQGAAAAVLVSRVNEVAATPCGWYFQGLEDVGDSPRALVAALARLPRHRVVVAPEPDDRFGYPGTHLRLRAGDLSCPGAVTEFELFLADHGLIASLGSRSILDLWVVDVGRHPVLVAATWTPNSPDWLVRETAAVLASVRLVPASP